LFVASKGADPRSCPIPEILLADVDFPISVTWQLTPDF